MVAWSAVAYEAKGAKQPTLGTLRIEATTSVSLEDRLVSFADFRFAEVSFPALDRSAVGRLSADLHHAIPIHDRIIDLDRVLTAVDRSTILVRETPGVKADPPTVYFSSRPAVLVNIDGDPVWSPIAGVDLKFAVNTNWDLFHHEPTRTIYLRHEATWLKTGSLQAPWQPAGTLPESFQKLPADTNWQDVRASLPGRAVAADRAPTVIVST
jgi:hypothetical protein